MRDPASDVSVKSTAGEGINGVGWDVFLRGVKGRGLGSTFIMAAVSAQLTCHSCMKR